MKEKICWLLHLVIFVLLLSVVTEVSAQTWRLDAEDSNSVFRKDDGIITIEAPKGATLWYPDEMHGNVIIEYEARIIPDERFKDKNGRVRVSDLNCFWMADRTDPEGGSGRFVNNYALKMYYVGYGGNGNTTTRFRKYTGDARGVTDAKYRPAILKEYTDSAHLLSPEHWYKIRLESVDSHVRYYIDGECIVDYIDPEPLTHGYFGFRTTLAKAQLRNFRYKELSSAKAYYVAVDGDDSNPGTIEHPFASLRKAQEMVVAGDTVYIRGGVYNLTNDDIMHLQDHFYHCVFMMDKSGCDGHRICYYGYPGERPIFNLDKVLPSQGRISAFFVTGSYLHFRNFDIVGTHVIFSRRNTQSECISNRGGSNNIYEDLAMHDGEAIGFYLTSGSNNLVLNCDAYRNWEVTETSSGGGRGGNVDGFGGHPAPGGTGNIFRGCRAWLNADDGFDLINASESVTIDNCWAFLNGYKPDDDNSGRLISMADGNGIKAGGYGMKERTKNPDTIPMHRVTNSIAYGNKASGFYANHHLGGVYFANNTSYQNRFNYNMVCRKSPQEAVDVNGYGHVLLDNVGYKAWESEIRALDYDSSEVQGCTFNLDLQLTDEDFISLDPNELTQQRKSDGSLPEIDFLCPTEDSYLSKAQLGHTFHNLR